MKVCPSLNCVSQPGSSSSCFCCKIKVYLKSFFMGGEKQESRNNVTRDVWKCWFLTWQIVPAQCYNISFYLNLPVSMNMSLCAQSCLTLCNTLDCSPPGSIYGLLQARILEWIAISFSRVSSWPRDHTCLPHCRQILYRLSPMKNGKSHLFYQDISMSVYVQSTFAKHLNVLHKHAANMLQVLKKVWVQIQWESRDSFLGFQGRLQKQGSRTDPQRVSTCSPDPGSKEEQPWGWVWTEFQHTLKRQS